MVERRQVEVEVRRGGEGNIRWEGKRGNQIGREWRSMWEESR